MPAIEIRGLTKSFGKQPVLRQLDLQLADIGRLAIMGPSGAGKSTLLRIVAGVERADAGQICLDGLDLTPLKPDRRSLALMSQEYALYPQLSVRKNLEAALLSLKLTRLERASRCDQTLQWFGIEQFSERTPAQLSGGQAQRVALAKALIRQPRLLLLDEPFSQLDGPLRNELRELTQRMAQQFGTAVMFVTHDPLDAMLLATSIAVLREGRIEQLGTPTSVYSHPHSRSAAELLSPWGVNWLTVSLLNAGSSSPSAPRDLSIADLNRALGFRPESSRLESLASTCPDKLSKGEPTLRWTGVVERASFVGTGYLTYIRTGEHVLRSMSAVQHFPGDQLALFVDRSALLNCPT